jgi:hypothetical protein
MKIRSKAIVKRDMLSVGLLARLVVVTTAFSLRAGFRPDQLQQTLLILLPTNALYLTMFVVFLIKNAYRYQRTVKKLNKIYIYSGFSCIIAANLAEVTLIVLKALNSDNLPGDLPYYGSLLVTEALLAIFTAIFPANLVMITGVKESEAKTFGS